MSILGLLDRGGRELHHGPELIRDTSKKVVLILRRLLTA